MDIPATPAGFNASDNLDGTITFSWTPVTGATEYRVWSADAGFTASVLGESSSSVRSNVIGAWVSHTYFVTAENSFGGSSPSNSVTLSLKVYYDVTGITATAGAPGSGSITISWNTEPAAILYDVLCDSADGTTTFNYQWYNPTASFGLMPSGVLFTCNVRAQYPDLTWGSFSPGNSASAVAP